MDPIEAQHSGIAVSLSRAALIWHWEYAPVWTPYKPRIAVILSLSGNLRVSQKLSHIGPIFAQLSAGSGFFLFELKLRGGTLLKVGPGWRFFFFFSPLLFLHVTFPV
jgi:hypothetical protein